MTTERMETFAAADDSPEDLGFADFLRELSLRRISFAVVVCVCTLAGLVAGLVLPDSYRSSALLAPSQMRSNGIGSMLGQYGGLASLAGLDLGFAEDGESLTVLGLEVLQSRKFLLEFLAEHDFAPELYAAESWDARTGEVTYDESEFDPANRQWVREPDPPLGSAPSDDDLYEEFIDRLTVTQDRTSGLVRVEFVHPSSAFAEQLIDLLVADLNAKMREYDIVEAQRSIEYLREEIRKTPLAELQALLYQLVQKQTETLMLAQARPEYVFRVVDPPFAPVEPIFPKPVLFVLAGFLIGVLGFTVWVIVSWSLLRLGDAESS